MVKIADDESVEILVRQVEARPRDWQSTPTRRAGGSRFSQAALTAAMSGLLDRQQEENPTQYLKQREQQAGE